MALHILFLSAILCNFYLSHRAPFSRYSFFSFSYLFQYIYYIRCRSTLSFDINIQSVFNEKLQPNTEHMCVVCTYTMAKTGIQTNSGFMYWCCLHFNCWIFSALILKAGWSTHLYTLTSVIPVYKYIFQYKRTTRMRSTSTCKHKQFVLLLLFFFLLPIQHRVLCWVFLISVVFTSIVSTVRHHPILSSVFSDLIFILNKIFWKLSSALFGVSVVFWLNVIINEIYRQYGQF